MKVNREQFLTRLQSIQPGLSQKEVIEQSSCFVFEKGKVYTFNDEICCQIDSGLDMDFSGAVPAKKMVELLEKKHDEEVRLIVDDTNKLIVAGKKRRAKRVDAKIGWDSDLRLEREIVLSIDTVEQPRKWRKLPVDEFTEAVGIVVSCAGTDDARFSLTCVHFHPEYIEACDNFQLTRYNLAIGIKEPFLIRRNSLKHVTTLGMTEFGETDSWLHFRNPMGMVLSCRRYLEEFPDLSQILDVKGKPIHLPGGLAEKVECANIFSSEAADDNKVMVELQPGIMNVIGQGPLGSYRENMELDYKGPPLAFLIAPNLLIELTKKHNSCQIAPERLKVDGGRYQYISCLSKVKEVRECQEAQQEEVHQTNGKVNSNGYSSDRRTSDVETRREKRQKARVEN